MSEKNNLVKISRCCAMGKRKKPTTWENMQGRNRRR
jgi:hypothetical protein